MHTPLQHPDVYPHEKLEMDYVEQTFDSHEPFPASCLQSNVLNDLLVYLCRDVCG